MSEGVAMGPADQNAEPEPLLDPAAAVGAGDDTTAPPQPLTNPEDPNNNDTAAAAAPAPTIDTDTDNLEGQSPSQADEGGGGEVDDDDDDTSNKKRPAEDGSISIKDDQSTEPDSKKFKMENNDDDSRKRGRKPLKRRSSGDGRGGPSPSWNDMFFALMAFKAKLGTFNVPVQTKLGKWVSRQRQEYSKLQRKKVDLNRCHELSEERIQVLDSLGFIWDTMLHENDRRWNQRFEELKQWKEEHGHCNVPQSTSLGQWVKIQRENKREADLKKEGKLPQRTKPKPCLAPDRVEKLDSLGFQWRVAAPVTGWENRYQQLLEYAKQHNGDVNVPQYYPQDKSFGRWVMKQRSEYSLRLRGLKSQLTDERVEKLNAIGFSWVAPNFKRKVGVGIAPGSPAANIAANMDQPGDDTTPKLPPMEKPMLHEAGGDGNQQQQMLHHHHPHQQQQQTLETEGFQGLHHDPHQMEHHHQLHNPDQGQHANIQQHQQQQHHHEHDDVVHMEFL